jgi:type IX secretion system PorP/SprF family membrane protein
MITLKNNIIGHTRIGHFKNIRYVGFIIMIFIKNTSSYAQQLPIFTQYREYHSLMNPASISSDYFLNQYATSVGASLRTQWIGVTKHPKTQILKGEHILKKDNYFSLVTGGHILNDQAGASQMTGVYGRIAALGSNKDYFQGFSAGFNIGYVRLRMDGTAVTWHDANTIDPSVKTQSYPDIGFGIFGYKALTKRGEGDNIIYGGISVPQLLSNTTFLKTILLKREAHIYTQVGYYKYLASQSFIEFSMWGKYVKNAPFHLDFNTRFQFIPAFWLGIGASSAKTIHAETGYVFGENFGLKKNALRIGYGFGLNMGQVANYLGTSHEINISYLIGQ